jgi:hypothetical protein
MTNQMVGMVFTAGGAGWLTLSVTGAVKSCHQRARDAFVALAGLAEVLGMPSGYRW